MNDRTLITGATGFLGSEIVRQFEAEGVPVRTTARSAEAALPDYRPCDLAGLIGLDDLVAGTRCVVHAAGLAHQFGAAGDEAELFFQANVAATETLAEAAAKAGVKHFVFVSSVSVYGIQNPNVCTEETQCDPDGSYAQSKYDAEQRLIKFVGQTDMQLTILRLATLFGESDPGNIGRLMGAIDSGRFVWIGDGRNRKTLIHRDDAARAIVLAAGRPDGAQVGIYNVAAPPVPMREIVETLASALGKTIPRVRLPQLLVRLPLGVASRIFFVRARASRHLATVQKFLRENLIDAAKFAREFDFSPSVEFAEGIRREVESYRSATKEKAL